MATRYTDEFRRDAVKIATTGGLTRPQIASDLGVGLSTLNRWVQKHPLPGRHCVAMSRGVSLQAQNTRLRPTAIMRSTSHPTCWIRTSLLMA